MEEISKRRQQKRVVSWKEGKAPAALLKLRTRRQQHVVTISFCCVVWRGENDFAEHFWEMNRVHVGLGTPSQQANAKRFSWSIPVIDIGQLGVVGWDLVKDSLRHYGNKWNVHTSIKVESITWLVLAPFILTHHEFAMNAGTKRALTLSKVARRAGVFCQNDGASGDKGIDDRHYVCEMKRKGVLKDQMQIDWNWS